MEYQQFKVFQTWLQEIYSVQMPNDLILVSKGREVIAYVLETYQTLFNMNIKISDVIALSVCSRTHMDSEYNFSRFFQANETKYQTFYCENNDMVAQCARNGMEHLLDNENQEKREVVFLVTAGRNGLPQSFVQWIKEIESTSVNHILYSSCNPKITLREMQWFLDLNMKSKAFLLKDYRILNMHPCTKYHTFVGLFSRIKFDEFFAGNNRVLILPIGGYKCGKTFFMKCYLESKFPLEYIESGKVLHFERDAVFYNCKKEKKLSFKKAKLETHEMLFDVLSIEHNCNVLYLDSTNGSKEQRMKYCEEFQPTSVILINFRMDSVSDEQSEYQRMIRDDDEFRMANDIPLTSIRTPNEQIIHYQKVWQEMTQYADETEVNEITANCKIQNNQCTYFDINGLDFDSYTRSKLAYNILQFIFL